MGKPLDEQQLEHIPEGPREEARRAGYSNASYRRGAYKDLVWAKCKWEQPASHNLLAYSMYNPNGWTVTGSQDAGLVSIGAYADENIIHWGTCGVEYDDYWQIASCDGVQTWLYQGVSLATSSSVNVASYQAPYCFTVEIGPNHTTAGVPFKVKLLAEDGAHTTLGSAIFTLDQRMRIWVPIPYQPSDGQLIVSIRVTYDGTSPWYWWFGWAQLEYGTTTPGPYVATNGSAVIYPTPVTMRAVAKVFPDEVEYVPEPHHGIVTPREGQDQSSYVIPHAVDDSY